MLAEALCTLQASAPQIVCVDMSGQVTLHSVQSTCLKRRYAGIQRGGRHPSKLVAHQVSGMSASPRATRLPSTISGLLYCTSESKEVLTFPPVVRDCICGAFCAGTVYLSDSDGLSEHDVAQRRSIKEQTTCTHIPCSVCHKYSECSRHRYVSTSVPRIYLSRHRE